MIGKKELILAGKLLEIASNEFSNHGCNDVPDEFWQGWSIEERINFVKEFHEWNGDPEEYDENFLNLGDSTIMSYLANKLQYEQL